VTDGHIRGTSQRLRIAYFSPLSPICSGISDYSETLLPELAKYADLDLFVDGYQPASDSITARFAVYDANTDRIWRLPQYHLALYHLGNNPYHAYIYKALRYRPGVVVLHDALLHHLIVEETLAKQDRYSYVREMGYAHGREGAVLALAVARRQRVIPYFEFPLLTRAVDLSLGVIVHSNFARAAVLKANSGARVAQIPHFAWPHLQPFSGDLAWLRRDLGLDPAELVISSFGWATPTKRVDVILRAYRRLRERWPCSRLLWVGEAPAWFDLHSLIDSYGLSPYVTVTGYTDEAKFIAYIAASDVCLSLRHPTAGETSGAVLRLMGMAKAVIVSDVGWFSELPADCCLRVPVDDGEEDNLVAGIEKLASDFEYRAQLGQNARRYVELNNRLEDVAGRYAEFLTEVWQHVVQP